MAFDFTHIQCTTSPYSFGSLLLLGQDATEAFEDVGHSDEARALLPGMFIGDFEQGSVSIYMKTPLFNHF